MKLLLALALCLPAFAQDAAWDNTPHAANLAQQAARLKPLMEQLAPQDWIAKGASETYVSQLNRVKLDIDGLANAAATLDRQPTRLTAALDTYFRLQTIEWEIESLIDVVRRYQTDAIADQLSMVLHSNSGNREALRDFITDLAQRKEQEFTVVDKDLASCRVQLTKIPTTTTRRSTK